jgi:hypothetical protein
MKTAMQEAIELVKKYDNREIPMKVLFYNLELLLEKEKEQIICSYIANRYVNAGGYPTRRDEAEDYYNQTYNN